jgi:hypothetical protein
MNAPEYKKIVERLRQCIEEQRNAPFIAINKWHAGRDVPFSVLDKVWPKLMLELGLVDDGTGTQTYTLPGRGFTVSAYAQDIAQRVRVRALGTAPGAAATPKVHEGISPEDIKRRWKAWKKDDPSRASVSLKTWVKQELEKLNPDSETARALHTWLEGNHG